MSRRAGISALVAVTVAVAVVVGVVVSRPPAASPEARLSSAQRQAARLAAVLGHPAGSRAVDVGAGRDLRGYPYVATVVSLAVTATAAQVAGVVESMPAAVERAGLPSDDRYRQLTFLSANRSRLTVAWQSRVAPGPLLEAAAGWLAVAAAFGDRDEVSASVLSGGGIDYRLGLGAGRAGDPVRAYRSAARVAGADAGWDISATVGQATLRLASSGRIEASRLRTWDALLRATRHLGGPLQLSRLEVSFGDRVETHLAVLAPDRVADSAFTPTAYGADVWPAVRPQLEATASLTPHWSYFLSWAHRSRPASEELLALLFGDQGTSSSSASSNAWLETARTFVPAR